MEQIFCADLWITLNLVVCSDDWAPFLPYKLPANCLIGTQSPRSDIVYQDEPHLAIFAGGARDVSWVEGLSYGKSPIYSGYTHEKWWFSIANYVKLPEDYQRVPRDSLVLACFQISFATRSLSQFCVQRWDAAREHEADHAERPLGFQSTHGLVPHCNP